MKTSDSDLSRRRRSAQKEGSAAYQAKREELLRAAAEVFRDKGFDGATLNDIAARLDTDRASIYYYFASKSDLFQTLFRDVLVDVLDYNIEIAKEALAAEVEAPAKIRLLVDRLLASYLDNYPFVYLYIQEDMAKLQFDATPWGRTMMQKTKRLESTVRLVLQQGVDAGDIRADVPVILMTKAMFGMVNWTHRWLKPGTRNADARQVAEAFCTLFLDGARKPAQ